MSATPSKKRFFNPEAFTKTVLNETPGTKDDYLLQRDIMASARLNLQHFLLKETLGYLLHPSIPIKDNMRIADIATGTGIWALDLARSLPSTVSFECYDISADQFPPTEILPSNIRFGTFDGSDEIPAYLYSRFDVVRVSLLIAVVKHGNPANWIRNLTSMLKPGGHLMWMEANFSHAYRHSRQEPMDVVKFPAMGKFDAEWVEAYQAVLEAAQWSMDLGEHFTKAGLEHVKVDDRPSEKVLWKAFTEVAVLTQTELSQKSGNREAMALIPALKQDIKNGAIWPGLSPIVAIGTRPL